jgi:hypothetical protein
MCALNLETRIFDRILYEVDGSDIATSFIPLLENWYSSGQLPLVKQFFLIPNKLF